MEMITSPFLKMLSSLTSHFGKIKHFNLKFHPSFNRRKLFGNFSSLPLSASRFSTVESSGQFYTFKTQGYGKLPFEHLLVTKSSHTVTRPGSYSIIDSPVLLSDTF